MINQDSVRAAAGLAPCGRYVEIPGDDVLPFLGDPDPMLGEIAEFLTGARGDVDPDRTLFDRAVHRHRRLHREGGRGR